jgi:hypothetical protein
MPKIVTGEKARQGRWGRQVLIVLIAGLLLALVAWGIAEIYGSSVEPEAQDMIGQADLRQIDLPT